MSFTIRSLTTTSTLLWRSNHKTSQALERKQFYDTLFARALELEKNREIAKAERMYERIIDGNPKDPRAYQQLWNSWVNYRSLRKPAGSLENFITKYKTHIMSQEKCKSNKKEDE